MLEVAIKVCQRAVLDLDEIIDDPDASFDELVSDAEWSVLGADEVTAEDLAEKKQQQWLKKYDTQ